MEEYDEPTQQDRMEVREKYRLLINDLHLAGSEENTTADLKAPIREIMDRTDNLFKKTHDPREVALDSTIMVSLTDTARHKVRSLPVAFHTFNNSEFAFKLFKFMYPEQEVPENEDNNNKVYHIDSSGWRKLGQSIQHYFRHTPSPRFLYGSFEDNPLEQRIRKPRQSKDKAEAVTNPESVKNETMLKEESTMDEVENVLKLLKAVTKKNKNQPICFFQFITNPNSFGQTIENLFYTSFLVRDGKASISMDNDELPVIMATFKKDEVEEQNDLREKTSNKQAIIKLTEAEWKKIVETFQITKENQIIPTRIYSR